MRFRKTKRHVVLDLKKLHTEVLAPEGVLLPVYLGRCTGGLLFRAIVFRGWHPVQNTSSADDVWPSNLNKLNASK